MPIPTFPPTVTTNAVDEPTVRRFETVEVPIPTPVPAFAARIVEETTWSIVEGVMVPMPRKPLPSRYMDV